MARRAFGTDHAFMINLMGPPPTSDNNADGSAVAAPTAPPRTRLASIGWLLFGLAGSIGGTVIAALATAAAIADSTDDFAGLWLIITVPAGFVIGTILITIAAAGIERAERSDPEQLSRTDLTFLGAISPILAAFASSLLAGALKGMSDAISDAAPTPTPAVAHVTSET